MSTILIVDDLEQNRYLVRAMLTAAGYEVVEASHGAEALELARRSRPDLIISDILMPQMDGFALCRECKRDEQLRDIPFCFYTATYTDPRDEAFGLQLGAVRYIAKPIEGEAFVAIVRELLQPQAAGQSPAPPPPLEEETTFYRLYNEALIRKLEDKMLDMERLNRNLAKSEERLRLMTESAPDMIYRYELVPQRGFTYVNPAATVISGYTPEEFFADPDLGSKIVHPDDRPLFEAMTRGKIASGQPITLRWTHKDGHRIWTEIRIVPVFNPAGELVAIEGITRDVTSRKQRERELEAIATLSAAQREAGVRSEMLPVILDQLLSLLEGDGAALCMLDPTSGELHIDLGRGVWAPLTGEIIPPGAGMSARVLASNKPYLNNDARSDPLLFRPDTFGACRSAAGAQLVAQGRIIGLLWIASTHPLTDGDLRLLITIADFAATAIHRAALHEETVRRVEQLEALKSIDHAITSSFDLHVTLNVLLEHVAAQLQVDAAEVLLYDPVGRSLSYAAGRGFRGRKHEHSHLRLGEGRAGRVALERRAFHIADLNAADSSFTRLPLLAGEGFVSYAAAPLISKGQIKGVLEVFNRQPFKHHRDWLNFLDVLAQQAAIAVDVAQLFDSLQKSNAELTIAYDATIEGWSHALDLRDRETGNHTLRVAEMTLKLARLAGISEEDLVQVRRGALLHDIGKMGVPDAILLKPDKLTDEEWVVMREHPMHAYEMLSPIAHLRPALDIPYCHHEKWDGSGYPRGLKGEQIPLAARLFAVVDVWDALRSDRPYRAGWPKGKVIEHIRSLSGTHFDPKAVEWFLQVVNEDAFSEG